MNAEELAANPQRPSTVVHDLNADPALPFADATFDDVVCCVSVDYLIRPDRGVRRGGPSRAPRRPFVCTFSNRCFPTKAIRGLAALDRRTATSQLVAAYFRRAGGWGDPHAERRPTPPDHRGDPLYAVWARRRSDDGPEVDRDRPTA